MEQNPPPVIIDAGSGMVKVSFRILIKFLALCVLLRNNVVSPCHDFHEILSESPVSILLVSYKYIPACRRASLVTSNHEPFFPPS